jgi:hypothetical protein
MAMPYVYPLKVRCSAVSRKLAALPKSSTSERAPIWLEREPGPDGLFCIELSYEVLERAW